MPQDLFFDTNIIIDYLNQYERSFTNFFEFQKNSGSLFLSVISIYELIALPGLSKNEEYEINVFISNFTVVPVNQEIAQQAGLLARTRPSRNRRSDLLIAASALVYNIPLVTKNLRDFIRIPNLKIV